MSSHSGEEGDVEREWKRQSHAEPEKDMVLVMDPTMDQDMVLEADQVQPKDRPSSFGTKSDCLFDREYDVFINFRDKDVRKSFVGHLYYALVQKGVRAYLDSEDLCKGDSINKLFIAIERSAAFITIFSKQYAESKWCLMKIEKIVDCKRKILPIFFDVEPREVRNQQTGAFSEGFEKHMCKEKVDTVNKWKKALSQAANISGYVLEEDYHGDDARLIADVVKKVLNEVCNKVQIHVAEHPVGMDFHLRKMTDMLRIDQVNKVRFVGICGIGGLGKTTIAKATFNEFWSKFECSSFLGNVRAKDEKEGGILQLQKDLIRDLFSDENPCITDASRGIELIKQRVHGKRVLVILDDVDKRDQIQYLVGDGTWLHEGSRVVITTRDRGVLTYYGLVEEDHIYVPDKLNEIQSLELFGHFAFKRVKPVFDEDLQLATEIVYSIGKLPLVLKVLGSHFSSFEMELWGELLKELMLEPHIDVQKILRISFDDLEEEEKQIFLDIACFFLESDGENAIYMWEACKLYPRLCLKILEQKSFVQNIKGEFQMHNEIRDMAREIIRQENPSKPWGRSRAWTSGACLKALTHCEEGSQKIEALLFDPNQEGVFTAEPISKMSGLRMLIGDDSCRSLDSHKLQYDFHQDAYEKLPGDSSVTQNQLPEPKWLRWCHYSYESLPQQILNLSQLVVLELPYFQCACLNLEPSGSYKGLYNLKVLSFFGSEKLRKTPDFSIMPQLEKLILRNCSNLTGISPSIGVLTKLRELDTGNCEELESLPDELSQCTSLKRLNVHNCKRLSSFPIDIGNGQCVVTFE